MVDPTFWKGKKVFITGTTGFKGAWLSLWLEKMGAEVKGYSLPPPTVPSMFDQVGLKSRQDHEQGDIRDLPKLKESISLFKPEIVFHLAAQSLVRESYVNPIETYSTNVMGTVNVLESLRGVDSARALVIITTDKCYENREWVWGYREADQLGGFDPYSNSKACAELVTDAYRKSFFSRDTFGVGHNLSVASARAGNVIGGGDYAKDRLIPDLVKSIQAQEKIVIRNPEAIRPWQHVLEPLAGYLILGQRLFSEGQDYAQAWNFGPSDSEEVTVRSILEIFCSQFPDNKGYVVNSKDQPHEAMFLKLDCSKAKAVLNWTSKWNVSYAVEKIVEWTLAPLEKKLEITRKQIEEYQDQWK